jgi:ferrous iron transport protein A
MILKMIFNFTSPEPPMPETTRHDAPEPLLRLAELHEGDHAVLSALDLPQHTAEHLMCLGFIPGVEVTVGKSGPGGDPRVYNVDGSNVALRRDVSYQVSVVPVIHRTNT